MYSASAQFHNAVFENSPVERVLFKFADGTIFTNEDINISAGLKVIEAVNLEEELTIGGCPASSLEATIMNYHGLLSGFAFGEAEVSLGVRTEVVVGNPVSANAVTYVGSRQFCGYSTEPYLKLDGEATVAQPGFPVHAIVAEGMNVYCIGLEGQCWKATLASGQTWASLEPDTWADLEATTWDSLQGTLTEVGNVTLSAFMTAKAAGWAAQGRGLWSNGGVVYEYYTSGNAETYEYVKLGTFLLNTPAKRKINMIAVSALDRMSLFDVAADDLWNDLAYPITIGEIFTQLCAFVGVPKATITFMNSTRSFAEAPLAADGITAREILGWIAEAACSFARMTRDGEVELAWFGVRPVSIPMTQYFSIAPAEYEVAQVDKLQISGSETDIGVVIGEGTNGYQILDNPLLYGATDIEVRTLGVPIYNRLIAYAAFSPIVAAAVCDWSIQAGDIIEIALNGVPYALPVYTQTITWKGNARVTYESTGAEKRPVMTASNRRLYKQKRAIHEVSETVDGLTRRIEDTEGNVANLELFADSLTLSIANGSTSSTLKLMAGSTELSSANITLTGMVTFANLTDGVTQISGGNIKTGTIAAARIDVDNLYVKHLNAADGTFTGTLSAANGTFSTLDAVGGLVHLGWNYIEVNNVEIGYVPGYSEVCVIGPGYQQGNLGSGNTPWSQCVARYLYSATGSVSSYSMRKLKRNIERYSLPDGYIDRFEMSTFIMNRDPDERIQLGAIADDVLDVCPYLVHEFQDDGMDEPILTLDYSKFGVIAIDEIQKLRKRVKQLEEMIGGLQVG